MPASTTVAANRRQSLAGKVVSAAIVAAAFICCVLVVRNTTSDPRTDDAEVFANFIGIAPVVEGPLIELRVKDNQAVRQGELLFTIDDAPYLYALQNAKSQQATLEGQIANTLRQIQSQVTASKVAQVGIRSSEASAQRAAAAVRQAEAAVTQSRAALQQATAESSYAANNLARLQPLLAKHFVTVDQLDLAKTNADAHAEAVRQATAQLALSEARLQEAGAQQTLAGVNIEQSSDQYVQAQSAVELIAPLTAQREGRAAAVRKAQYDYDHCKIYAPFDARVTNLQISEGAFAHVGQRMFTLIDTRTWWVIANFRESQLKHIHIGAHTDVYAMAQTSERLSGEVESIGYGVLPDPGTIGTLTQDGLPDALRTLNWVHLASRYPVRIRVNNPPPGGLRIGESSAVIIHKN
jgi:multidrug efflux system membrane fusion protein